MLKQLLEYQQIQHFQRIAFNSLLKWRFDEKRLAQVRRFRKRRKSKQIQDILDENLLLWELDLECDMEILRDFYPLFGENIQYHTFSLYRILENTITIEHNGMGGFSFRNSKEETIKILERNGYNHIIVVEYIEMYEDMIINEFYKSKEKEEK